ncbi:hypothetical protein SB748_25590 [Rhizobium sp. SIMBA_035]
MSEMTDGANDRPTDATNAQSGAGLPDDCSQPLEAPKVEIERAQEQLRSTLVIKRRRKSTSKSRSLCSYRRIELSKLPPVLGRSFGTTFR